jgi:GTP-dependent phosphoenolpyruvate carboxykinase
MDNLGKFAVADDTWKSPAWHVQLEHDDKAWLRRLTDSNICTRIMTAMPKPILFYDIASSLNTTTSVNTLKTK